jgi:sulfate transport system ATP-binding protein
MAIDVRNVTKAYGSFTSVKDVSFSVASGELVALLGPSGSGKTTLLRIIAGLETADAGTVLLGGEDATDTNARDRAVGFVFQHYALFRHMTVFENVAFGLRVRPRRRRPSDAEISRKVKDLLTLVQLDYLGNRYPSQLSGGQRQRVALARALAVEPRVLLLDEPFGALDAKVRQELRRWLRRLHEEIHLTSLFVTHDQEEALELAGRVVIMDRGQIEQQGSPEEVFDRPATPFVMNFLGHVNIFHGRVESGKALLGPLAIDYPAHTDSTPQPAEGYARPYELDLSRTELSGGLWAIVVSVAQTGSLARVELADDEARPMQVELSRERFVELAPTAGERFYVTPRNVRVFLTKKS